MTRRIVTDWYAHDRLAARFAETRLKKALPKQWGAAIGLLAVHDKSEPVWRKDSAWLEKLQAFKKAHGQALNWAMSDADICTRATATAAHVEDLIALWPDGLPECEKLDTVMIVCDSVGVDYPKALTVAGAIARGTSPHWWRRVLRRKVARIVEHGAIKLGLVNKAAGGYASNDAVQRRRQQLARNEAMLKSAVMRNEAGQYFTLSDLAKKSTANPAIRGGELMTRIRGCEEFAEGEGHVGLFLTLTTPSRFHAVNAGGKTAAAKPRPNPRYDTVNNPTPRDAQLWLRTMWARARAMLARLGVSAYGFRVAEPHHDGTPHWHALLWVKNERDAMLLTSAVWAYWLSDGGDERGAADNRINVKRMVRSDKNGRGGAAGYIAKYIAKNIGHFDVGDYMDQAQGLEFSVWAGDVKGWQRVDAWAATWGIRQFQAIGQPSVTVWRELRRVTKDQVEAARIDGDGEAWNAWCAVHREGDLQACWRRYMAAMGGVCIPRAAYRMRPACRVTESVNDYGETFQKRRIVGLELNSGRWLVSRRQAWARVIEKVSQGKGESKRLAAPWTGFNNCTARLGGTLRAALMGLKSGDVAPGWWDEKGGGYALG